MINSYFVGGFTEFFSLPFSRSPLESKLKIILLTEFRNIIDLPCFSFDSHFSTDRCESIPTY